MTPGARLSAAIEVLADIDTRHRPAADALRDWGLSRRFAGSGDRAAISGLVYDALRRRASAAFIMGEEVPRAILLGMLRLERKLDTEAIARLADGARFAPSPLTEEERKRLDTASLERAPNWVFGDYPAWFDPHLARVFGNDRGAEGAALASRAPLDLRVNTLKTKREAVVAPLAHLGATPTPWSPVGMRIALSADSKSPAVHAEPAYLKGLIEVQDEGSQLAALLARAEEDRQVVDLCAGGGGKTLALAAAMGGHGQIYATDRDKRRLAPIHARIARARARNIQVRTPRGESEPLADLAGRSDLVLIDAPCTGTGAWRRNPDAKWRVRPGALAARLKEQTTVLETAAGLVKLGGRIAYVTCSVLAEENDDQVRSFLERHGEFTPTPPGEVVKALGDKASAFGCAVLMSAFGVLMTPRRTNTDGFFVSVLMRRIDL